MKFSEIEEMVVMTLAIELEDIAMEMRKQGFCDNLTQTQREEMMAHYKETKQKSEQLRIQDRIATAGTTLVFMAVNYGVDVDGIIKCLLEMVKQDPQK